ncbi:protein TIC 55, chloroplastic [Tanacetum coccineum]
MSLLLHHPFIFTNTLSLHTYKTPSLTLSHTSKPLTAKWAAKCTAAAVSSPEISKEDGVLVGEEKGRVGVVDYDWTEEWYPLYLAKNIPDDAPLGLTVFDKLSLCWYKSKLFLLQPGLGQLAGMFTKRRVSDRLCLLGKKLKAVVYGYLELFFCLSKNERERLAKLSEGQIVDGRLECLYHGWQFEGEGKCVKIPQNSLSSQREMHLALAFKVTERTDRGFAGWWGREAEKSTPSFLRFEAPCNLQNNREIVDKDGVTNYFSGLFLFALIVKAFETWKNGSVCGLLAVSGYFCNFVNREAVEAIFLLATALCYGWGLYVLRTVEAIE